jgi:hypothetical protein
LRNASRIATESHQDSLPSLKKRIINIEKELLRNIKKEKYREGNK